MAAYKLVRYGLEALASSAHPLASSRCGIEQSNSTAREHLHEIRSDLHAPGDDGRTSLGDNNQTRGGVPEGLRVRLRWFGEVHHMSAIGTKEPIDVTQGVVGLLGYS